MPRYDLAGNPLPDDPSTAPKYDLAGNPIAPLPGAAPVRYDLAGNPIGGASAYQPPPPYGSAPRTPPAYGAPQNPPAMSPLGGGPPQGQPSYGQPSYGQPSYGQPQYGQPPSGQPGYGQPVNGQPSYLPPGVPGYSPPPAGSADRYRNGYVQPTAVMPSNGNSKRGIGIGIGVGIAVLLVAIIAFVEMPRALPATTQFTSYADRDGTFNCDAPAGWDVLSIEDIGSNNSDEDSDVGGVLFKKFGAKIDITTDLVSKLTAAMLFAPGDGTDALTGSKLPLLVKQSNNKAKLSYSNFSPLGTQGIDSSFGEASETEFTATGPKFGFPQATHGYVVEMCGFRRSCVIIASCPESDWGNAKPVFDRVISTMAEGSRQAPTQDQAPAGPSVPATTDYTQPNYDTGAPQNTGTGNAGP